MTEQELSAMMRQREFLSALREVVKEQQSGGWRRVVRDIALVTSLIGVIGFGILVGRNIGRIDEFERTVNAHAAQSREMMTIQMELLNTQLTDIRRRLARLEGDRDGASRP